MSIKSTYGLTQKVLQSCSIVALAAGLAACGPEEGGSSSGTTSSGTTSSGTTSSGTTSSGTTSSGTTSSGTTSSGSSSSSSSSSSSGGADKTPFSHKDNVFASVNNWYVNQWWRDNAIAEGGSSIANHNTGVWMDRIGAIETYSGSEIPAFNDPDYGDLGGQSPADNFGLRDHLEEAERQGNALFHMVSYNLPGRDCAAVASNGELPPSEVGMQVYQEHYVDRIHKVLSDFPNVPVAIIIEIDSLPNLVTNAKDEPCQEVNNTKSWGYTNGVRYSINKYAELDNVHIYVDAGHSGWLGWDDDLEVASLFLHGVVDGFEGLESTASDLAIDIEAKDGATGKYEGIGSSFVEPPRAGPLTAPPGYGKIDGFITNTSNYTPLEEPYLGDPDGGADDAPLRSAYFYDWNPRFDELTFTKDWIDAIKGHAGGGAGHVAMIIDTGRNGWGGPERPSGGSTENADEVDDYRIDRREHRGNWCNQFGGVGMRPQANPESWIDAYVWTKPQGESDGISTPNFTPDPADPNKKHDPMCDPDELSTYGQKADSTKDLNLGTSAMGDVEEAPHAGRWYGFAFRTLLENAHPAECDGQGDDC